MQHQWAVGSWVVGIWGFSLLILRASGRNFFREFLHACGRTQASSLGFLGAVRKELPPGAHLPNLAFPFSWIFFPIKPGQRCIISCPADYAHSESTKLPQFFSAGDFYLREGGLRVSKPIRNHPWGKLRFEPRSRRPSNFVPFPWTILACLINF